MITATKKRIKANGERGLANVKTPAARSGDERIGDAESSIVSTTQRRKAVGGGPKRDTRREVAACKSRVVEPPPVPEIPCDDSAASGDRLGGNGICAATCRELQELQRRKVATLKSRIMIDNQLAALVSTELGYHAGMDEKERKAVRKKATCLIAAITKGNPIAKALQPTAARVSAIVQSTHIAREGFDAFLSGIEKEMLRICKTLPISKWIEKPELRGVGLLSVATIIGEAGDLSNYANPGKLWRRLGLAPFDGKMPSTWRKEGGLSSEQWTEIGYSPRRRSVMYVIGECIVKANGKGPYRQRYDESKASAAKAHPGKDGWTKGHCHNHGMLLATKRLVRDMWREWRGQRS